MASHHANDRNNRSTLPAGYHQRTPGVAPRRPAGSGGGSAPQAQRPALSDQRFQDLLMDASRFFAQAEDDGSAAKQAAIADILATMARYQLTTADLA